MSIHKVERKVDTVIIEMDISMAEKLAEVIGNVIDKTSGATFGTPRNLDTLLVMLGNDADVRWPSPLYESYFSAENPEAVTLRDRI